jgi:hypothetical protein
MPRHTKIVQIFNVRVRAKSFAPVENIPWDSGEKYAKSKKIYGIACRTMEQACAIASRYGTPIRCEKSDLEAEIGRKMTVPPAQIIYANPNPYNNAIAMDEMIWNRRNKRIENREKDKK